MWDKIITMLFLLTLRSGVVFAPREKYEQKVVAIEPLSQKTDGYDTSRWSYRSVESPTTGMRYRYYTTRADSTAPVMVCIHGLFLDGRTFVNLAPYMSDRRLVALNLPQRSDVYSGTIDDYVTIVVDFIRALDIRSCTLMGVSFGGIVALRTAAQCPADLHFDHLVLAASGLPDTTANERNGSRGMREWMNGLEDYQLYWFVEKVIRFTTRKYGNNDTGQLSIILTVKHPDWYREVAAAIAGYNALDDARSLTMPVLVLHARNDIFLDRKTRLIMRTVFPDEQYYTVENSDHTMVLTRAEKVAAHINRFLVN